MQTSATPELRKQVANQYRTVAYMGRALADVHADLVSAIDAGASDSILSIIGPRSASIMKQLGDILNGMDATDETDRWLDPIFAEAQRLFPTSDQPANPNHSGHRPGDV